MATVSWQESFWAPLQPGDSTLQYPNHLSQIMDSELLVDSLIITTLSKAAIR